jgi:hypothetical protein
MLRPLTMIVGKKDQNIGTLCLRRTLGGSGRMQFARGEPGTHRTRQLNELPTLHPLILLLGSPRGSPNQGQIA